MTLPFQPSRHNRAILVADWRDAEELAAWHMREVLGFRAVALTASGADAGVDVRSAQADAQVKHLAGAVGGPDIQRFRGATHGLGVALFYALHGYTRAAVGAADASEVALFTYTVYGDVSPENDYARVLLRAAESGGYREREQERFVPLSGRIREAGRLTKPQAHDLDVFILAQLAEVMLVQIDLPESCYPERRPWNRQPGDSQVLPRWKDFYQHILDAPDDLRGEYLEAAKTSPTASEWVGLLEGWWQRIQTARLREAILEDADAFTTTEELEEAYEERFDPDSGAQLVAQMWDDRRPGNLDGDLSNSARLVPAHLYLDDDLWGERWGDISWTDLGVDSDNPEARSVVDGSVVEDEFFDELHRARSMFAHPPMGLSVAGIAELLDEAIESKRYRSGAARAAV